MTLSRGGHLARLLTPASQQHLVKTDEEEAAVEHSLESGHVDNPSLASLSLSGRTSSSSQGEGQQASCIWKASCFFSYSRKANITHMVSPTRMLSVLDPKIPSLM